MNLHRLACVLFFVGLSSVAHAAIVDDEGTTKDSGKANPALANSDVFYLGINFGLFARSAHVNKGLSGGADFGRITSDARFMNLARVEYVGSSSVGSADHDWNVSGALLVQTVPGFYVGGLVGTTLNDYSETSMHSSLVLRIERKWENTIKIFQNSYTELDLGGFVGSAQYGAFRAGARFH